MATVVVSGRVDEDVKRQADHIIAREGKTPGDVIRDVWTTICETGKLPDIAKQEEKFFAQRKRFKEFLDYVSEAPPAPSWLVSLNDEHMNDMMASSMLGERHV